MPKRHWIAGLVFRAGFLALFLNLPAISEYLRSDGNSPRLFSDWDEPYYLTVTYSFARIPWTELLERAPWTPLSNDDKLRLEIPGNLLDVLVGKIALFSGLRPVGLALLLDVVCLFASYFWFSRAFGIIGNSALAGEIAAGTMLLIPWVFLPEAGCDAPLNFLTAGGVTITSRTCSHWPTLPVWRTSYTQLSYPLWAVGFYFFSRARYAEPRSLRTLAAAGAVLGLLIYAYVFAWIPCLLVAGFLILFDHKNQIDIRRRIKDAAIFSAAAFLALLPGLLWFAAGVSRVRDSFLLPDDYPVFLYVSPALLLLILCFGIALIRASNAGASRILGLLLAIVLTEAILPNAQFFSRHLMMSYHFSIFYLEPLLSGAGVLGLLCYSGLRATRAFTVLALLFLAFFQWQSISSYWRRFPERNDELSELSRFIRASTVESDRLFFVSEFAPNFELPPEVEALTERRVIAPGYFATFFAREPEGISRELFVSWFLRDTVELFPPCGLKYDRSGDFPWFVKNWMAYRRNLACDMAIEIAKTFSPCETLRDIHADYFVWEKPVFESLPQEKKDLLEPVWLSSRKNFGLFRVRPQLGACSAGRG